MSRVQFNAGNHESLNANCLFFGQLKYTVILLTIFPEMSNAYIHQIFFQVHTDKKGLLQMKFS